MPRIRLLVAHKGIFFFLNERSNAALRIFGSAGKPGDCTGLVFHLRFQCEIVQSSMFSLFMVSVAVCVARRMNSTHGSITSSSVARISLSKSIAELVL